MSWSGVGGPAPGLCRGLHGLSAGLRSLEPGQYNVLSGPGQSHSDLGHSDTPETHEETPDTRGLRQRPVTSESIMGLSVVTMGALVTITWGFTVTAQEVGPVGGAVGGAYLDSFTVQDSCQFNLCGPEYSQEFLLGQCKHIGGYNRGGEKKWSNYGFTIRSERGRVTHVAT